MTLVLVITSESLRMPRLKGELEAEVSIRRPLLQVSPSRSSSLVKSKTPKSNVSFTSLKWRMSMEASPGDGAVGCLDLALTSE